MVKARYKHIFKCWFVYFFVSTINSCPIMRYETVTNEIENRKDNLNDFAVGVNLFNIGLRKKYD